MVNIQDQSVYKLTGLFNQRLSISWTLGTFCVYKCSYCPTELHDGAIPYHPTDKVLSMFNKLPNGADVIFLGGEPTYHPDFERIALEKPDGIRIQLITNGARPLEFWQRIGPKLHQVVFSFHPEFANVDRFIENALEILKHTHRFRVFLIMSPDKWDYCADVYNKLTSAGIIALPKPILKGFGMQLMPGYSPEQLRWIGEKNKTDNIKTITIFDKDNNVLLETSPNELLAKNQTNFTGFDCYSPLQHIAVEADGKIYNSKCAQKSLIGDLHTGEIDLPTTHMLCNTKFCVCQSDIMSGKIRSSI